MLKGGRVLEDNGWDMAAVLDFNDGDNDDRRVRIDRLGLALVVTCERTLACLACDAFMRAVATFLFFFDGFDGDAIVSLLCS